MMTHYQGFGISSLDELTVSSAQFNEFMDDADSCMHPIGAVYTATVRLLRYAFWLAKQKATLARKEYKELLKKLNWEGEEKRYLKIAAAFSNFTPQQLVQVEPRTIFQIAENLKKYHSVITKIATLAQITQDAVRGFMKQCRKPKAKKEEEAPTIWRMALDGKRVCQIGAIYNQSVGVMLQTMMDSEGLTAQAIVEEALLSRYASKYGRPVEEVSDSTVDYNVTHEVKTIDVEAPIEYEKVSTEGLFNETESAPVVSNSEVENLVVEELLVDVSSSLEEMYSAPESSWDENVIEDSWSFEPEERDNDINDYEFLTSVQQELAPSGFTSLTGGKPHLPTGEPVDFLIQTFQNARSWQEINEVLNTHEEYKERAWSALTPNERRRVIEMTPPEVTMLRHAKKHGLIIDFRELREGIFEVQENGSLFWKILYKQELEEFIRQCKY
jgi:hypothetical protein